MTHGLVVLVDVGTGTQFVEVKAVVAGQPGEDRLGLRLVQRQVQLAAVAGGEDRRLAAWRHPAQLLQGLHQLLGAESHALADRHGCGFMVDAEGEKSHAGMLRWPGSRQLSYLGRCRTTAWRSRPPRPDDDTRQAWD
ncbi:hypothetical protein D3C80_1083890 [compost metagenome]